MTPEQKEICYYKEKLVKVRDRLEEQAIKKPELATDLTQAIKILNGVVDKLEDLETGSETIT